MRILCLKARKLFTEYDYVSVGWSGDKLPVCPWCGASPYESAFADSHPSYLPGDAIDETNPH